MRLTLAAPMKPSGPGLGGGCAVCIAAVSMQGACTKGPAYCDASIGVVSVEVCMLCMRLTPMPPCCTTGARLAHPPHAARQRDHRHTHTAEALAASAAAACHCSASPGRLRPAAARCASHQQHHPGGVAGPPAARICPAVHGCLPGRRRRSWGRGGRGRRQRAERDFCGSCLAVARPAATAAEGLGGALARSCRVGQPGVAGWAALQRPGARVALAAVPVL